MTITGIWQDAICAYLAHQLRVEDVTAQTAKLRGGQLGTLARGIGVENPWAVTGAQLIAWCASRNWSSNNTRRSYRTTLRSFYRWGLTTGRTSTSPAEELRRVRPQPPRPNPVPDDIYRAALASAEPRVRLMIRLSAEAGLRPGEVALVHSGDLVEYPMGWSLLVHGKGRKDREVTLPRDLARELRTLPAGWAFPGRVEGHLSPRWVGRIVTRELLAGFTAHKLRHRAGTRFYNACGHDLRLTAEFLGHADTKTTMVYVAASRARMRAAVELGALLGPATPTPASHVRSGKAWIVGDVA